MCLWTERIWQKAFNQRFLFKKNPPDQCVYTVSTLPDQIVHSFVVVQDGTAIILIVLQIAAADPTARRAGLCSFSPFGPSHL